MGQTTRLGKSSTFDGADDLTKLVVDAFLKARKPMRVADVFKKVHRLHTSWNGDTPSKQDDMQKRLTVGSRVADLFRLFMIEHTGAGFVKTPRLTEFVRGDANEHNTPALTK